MPRKDPATEAVRRAVLRHTVAVETARAESGLTCLSFQSTRVPARHVWLDTDLGGQKVVDLEDWSVEGTWDNSVGHFTAAETSELVALVVDWLGGRPLAMCKDRSGISAVDLR